MASAAKIDAIADFVFKHPGTTASRRICREILGESLERFNLEFSEELIQGLSEQNEQQIESYYRMIR